MDLVFGECILSTFGSNRAHAINSCWARSVLLKVRFGDLQVPVCSMGLGYSQYVCVSGEKGDTIYEEMNGGMHKTLILREIVYDGSEKMGRIPSRNGREDVFPSQSPNIVTVTVSDDKEEFSSQEMIAALKTFSWDK